MFHKLSYKGFHNKEYTAAPEPEGCKTKNEYTRFDSVWASEGSKKKNQGKKSR